MTIISRKKIFFALLLLATMISGASAFTLAETSVLPLGYQPAGTPVTVTVVIGFPRQDLTSDTFPASHDLVMTTGLAGARWEPVLVLDERETRMPAENGGMATISGAYLSYPGTQDLRFRFILTGTMPADASPSKDLLRVQEVDVQGNVISTASIAMPEVVVVVPTVSTPPITITATRKLPTPLPTSTPAGRSPAGILSGILAAVGVLIAMRRGRS